MKVIVEKNIPFIKGLLEPYAEVIYLAPDEFTPAAVHDADALIVRTRTRCDQALLDGSKVSFVGTATIGTDHIDKAWCEAHGITVANAPGCNAPAVAQYVLSAVHRLLGDDLSHRTLGIVGVGHVGKIVERWARQLGMNVMLNDPPRQLAEGGDGWCSLADIAENADVVTFHTPLDSTTRHLVNAGFISTLRRKPVLINAARGPVFDTEAVVQAIDGHKISQAVIDCWEGEPAISDALLSRAVIATPHIAGYSYEGKVRATRMVLDALAAHFGLPDIEMAQKVAPGAAESVTAAAISASYDPISDTDALKSHPDQFETLRNHYALRHEV